MDGRNEKFSDAEASRRVETALRAAFNSPHKTYEQSKVGKKRGLGKPSPRPRSRKKREDRS